MMTLGGRELECGSCGRSAVAVCSSVLLSVCTVEGRIDECVEGQRPLQPDWSEQKPNLVPVESRRLPFQQKTGTCL